ncbi:hypothetical protein BDZ97DRAFT_939484 [Flammula alnicola]|nr:hypothetical protein BDZ97DRAFT_939484 [Flammula alnicola]
MKKWEREYNAHVRALEKGTIKGFEGLQNADVEEIDALKEMEKAKKEIQEREEKKAVTKGADGGPVAPKMNISVRSLLRLAVASAPTDYHIGKQDERCGALAASALDVA